MWICRRFDEKINFYLSRYDERILLTWKAMHALYFLFLGERVQTDSETKFKTKNPPLLNRLSR